MKSSPNLVERTLARWALSLVPALALILVVAPAADAAEISRSGGTVTYRGTPGEANALSVTDEDGDLVIRDSGAEISILWGDCAVAEGSGGHEAQCPGLGSSVWWLSAWLDDNNDRVSHESVVETTLRAGAGDDVLDARRSRADVVLEGDEDDDRLFGADLPDEGDWDSGDAIYGGPGNDVIEDPDGTNQLHGDAGDDHITAGFSRDDLHGGEGDDRLIGRGQRDQIYCGGGIDQPNAFFDEERNAFIHHVAREGEGCERGVADPQAWRQGWTQAEARVTNGWYLWYTAAPGQANDVSVVQEGDDLILTDRGASIRAAHGCEPVSGTTGHQVRCRGAQDLVLADLELADANDRAKVSRPLRVTGDPPPPNEQSEELGTYYNQTHARVRGGTGADDLSGSSGWLALEGGEGDDTATNEGGGAAMFDGGDGRDRLAAGDTSEGVSLQGGPDDDVLKGSDRSFHNYLLGGPGKDWLMGSQRRSEPEPSDTAGAQHDNLYGGGDDDLIVGGHGRNEIRGDAGDDRLEGGLDWNDMNGGEGDDRLMSSEAASLELKDGRDEMFGGPGDDLLSGGTGLDNLHGEDGADRLLGGDRVDSLFGGEGPDLLDGGPVVGNRYRCGGGFDTHLSGFLDIVDADCESRLVLERDKSTVTAAGSVSLPLVCRRTGSRLPCRGGLGLSHQGKSLGRAPISIPAGARRSVAVRLPPATRRQVRARGTLTVKADLSLRMRTGTQRRAVRVTLRARR